MNEEKIKLYKSQPWLTKEYKKVQKKLLKFLKLRGIQTPKEKALEKKGREIATEDFKTNNKECKFRFGHIEKALKELNFEPGPNIIFVYGKKNIGKTGALARKLLEMHDLNPQAQFVFVRNKMLDEVALDQLFQDDIWPVYLKGNKIFGKQKEKKAGKPKLAGGFTYSTGGGFQSLQGSSYDDVRLIIWDECNDTDGSKLTPETLYKFYIFTSSIIRDKKNVQIYMTGNLLSKQDYSVNIFLERMHVDPSARVKLIDIHKNNDPKQEIVSRLLYINAINEYKGIEAQKGLAAQFITEEEQESLFENLPRSVIGKSIYSEHGFVNLVPQFSICFRLKEQTTYKSYILYLAKRPNTCDFVVGIDPFDPRKIKPGYKPLTNDRGISCMFVAPFYIKDAAFSTFIKVIANLLQVGQLYFGYNNTLNIFTKVWDIGEPMYESYRKTQKII